MMLYVACANISNIVKPSDNTRMLVIMLFMVRQRTLEQCKRSRMSKLGSRIMSKSTGMLVLQ